MHDVAVRHIVQLPAQRWRPRDMSEALAALGSTSLHNRVGWIGDEDSVDYEYIVIIIGFHTARCYRPDSLAILGHRQPAARRACKQRHFLRFRRPQPKS